MCRLGEWKEALFSDAGNWTVENMRLHPLLLFPEGFARPFCPWCSKASVFWLCCVALLSWSKWETLSSPITVHVLFVWHRDQKLTNTLILKTGTRTTSVVKPPCLYWSPLLLLTVFGQHFLFTRHPGFPCPISACPSFLPQLLFWPLSSWVSNFRTVRCWWKPCKLLAAQMRKKYDVLPVLVQEVLLV